MNIRRWFHRRAPLIVAVLALVAAGLTPTPASARSAAASCFMRVDAVPTGTPSYVSAGASVYCTGIVSSISLSLHLTRDGTVVASDLSGGSYTSGAGALAVTTCVPGYYQATASGGVWYLIEDGGGYMPLFHQSSSRLYFDCVAPMTVTNPGSQWTFAGDSPYLQMTANNGTAPYTWSATGLPAGMSINSGTGLITGLARRLGTSAVTVTAVGADGRSASASFSWRVVRDNCPTC